MRQRDCLLILVKQNLMNPLSWLLILGVDPKHADQIVRGTVSLPNGIGKDIRILVFAKDDLAEEAKKAGADYVGAADMVEKVKGGWTDVDVVIAAPDMMAEVGKLGKILGPRGLMPNPKIWYCYK